jgi:hypothetical protein
VITGGVEMAYINGNKILNIMVNGTLSNVDEKVAEAYEQGQQSERDSFWDAFLSKGQANSYYYAFAYSRFTNKTYHPNHNIVCSSATTSAQNMFYNNYSITDTKVPIDTRNTSHIGGMFYNASGLKTVRKILIDGGVINGGALAFSGCTALQNITFEGDIAQNMYFGDSPLTVDSMNNIISCLRDYTGTTTTKTLTLGTTNLAKLSDSEKAIATQKGWTLA